MKFKASAGDMRCKAVKRTRINILLNMVKYGPYLLLRHIWIQLILLVAMFFLRLTKGDAMGTTFRELIGPSF
jgi:hypothetical protein